MIAVALLAVLSMQAKDQPAGHPLSLAAAKPLLAYFGCLFDPLADKMAILPASRTKRQRIVRSLIVQCRSTKERARAEALTSAASDADRAEIARSLDAAENQVCFVVVDHEKAVAADEVFCRARGEEPGC